MHSYFYYMRYVSDAALPLFSLHNINCFNFDGYCLYLPLSCYVLSTDVCCTIQSHVEFYSLKPISQAMTKRRVASQSRLERLGLLTSAWPICYSTIVLLSHSYLVYLGVKRYLIYNTILPEVSAYHLVTLCIAALLVPVIVVLSFLRLGSYTNDAVQGTVHQFRTVYKISLLIKF